MDSEPEELQFMGIVGIYSEAAKILAGWLRLFAKIALALILPLSLLFFAHIAISHLLFNTIDSDEAALDDSAPGSASESSALRHLASDWSAFLLFKGIYLLALLVLALLSTAAVVYSVASIYTARGELAFRKVLDVVPRVWRRLMATFLWAFLVLFALHSAAIISIIATFLIAGDTSSAGPAFVIFIIVPLYVVALVYISIVWHLASVVSVLEDARGVEAMRRARRLIQGKLFIACVIFVKLNLCFGVLEWAFRGLLLGGSSEGGAATNLALGLLLLLLLCLVLLFALVVQTVVYFVCKSYHHESIDKSLLADHLEAYLGEYVPLKSQDVQMEQFRV